MWLNYDLPTSLVTIGFFAKDPEIVGFDDVVGADVSFESIRHVTRAEKLKLLISFKLQF